ncbi:MAG: glycosyltransferase family 1 protein [Spirochaetaceae bacterium]|nr:MAG: glycosyltransferase family 1 protein [Spirochaetaceae bacterium]
MKQRKVIVISPPFFSHFRPLLRLSEAFAETGWQTLVACSRDFQPQIAGRRLGFVELVISRNANTGVAENTEQPEEERERINAFLEATRRGPLETLMLQAEHRKLDMLFEPEYLAGRIEAIQHREKADLYVVDQLSYGVTIALYLLDLPFVSFCPAHPYSIPVGQILYGVPPAWPEVFSSAAADRVESSPPMDPVQLKRLRSLSVQVEEYFTAEFNSVLGRSAPGRERIANAFRFTSPLAVLYNYPEFSPGREIAGARRIFLGSCFQPESLDGEWRQLLDDRKELNPKVLIALGTFLSARADVIGRCIRGILKAFPKALIIAGAGAQQEALKGLPEYQVLVRSFVPQIALLPQMDLFVHHGGNNSFTESLYYGVPAILLPFSSDQFNVARDAEAQGIASVLDPNRFNESRVAEVAVRTLGSDNSSLISWSGWVRERGPEHAVRRLEQMLETDTLSKTHSSDPSAHK